MLITLAVVALMDATAEAGPQGVGMLGPRIKLPVLLKRLHLAKFPVMLPLSKTAVTGLQELRAHALDHCFSCSRSASAATTVKGCQQLQSE